MAIFSKEFLKLIGTVELALSELMGPPGDFTDTLRYDDLIRYLQSMKRKVMNGKKLFVLIEDYEGKLVVGQYLLDKNDQIIYEDKNLAYGRKQRVNRLDAETIRFLNGRDKAILEL